MCGMRFRGHRGEKGVRDGKEYLRFRDLIILFSWEEMKGNDDNRSCEGVNGCGQ